MSTVHDELIVECPDDLTHECRAIVIQAMAEAMSALFPEVPVEVEANICTTLGRQMKRDDYSSRQSARDDEYRRQYEAWVAGMSPEERRALEAAGVDKPLVQHTASGCGQDGDFSDDPRASHGKDPALMPEPEPPKEHHATHDDEAVWDIVRRLLGELLARGNARLTVECLALVSGLAYTGSSMTEIAKRHGITRAAVSKRCCRADRNPRSAPVTRHALVDSPPAVSLRQNQIHQIQ